MDIILFLISDNNAIEVYFSAIIEYRALCSSYNLYRNYIHVVYYFGMNISFYDTL